MPMIAPNPHLDPDGPLEVVSARVLFDSPAVRRRSCAFLRRLDDGRILIVYQLGTGSDGRRNDGAVMVSHSDDGGEAWDEPHPLFAYPGWDAFPMGGIARLGDGRLRLIVARVQVDLSLGGAEPFTGWHVAPIDSTDEGRSWQEPGAEIDLFPCWTELYGASNAHPVSDGRLLWGVSGTLERDRGWRAGVAFSDAMGGQLSEPVVIAAAPDRDYSEIELIRLDDGRFLAVIREHGRRESFVSHSADEGQTWAPIRPTGFRSANMKLHRLASGDILCLYRDEDPSQRGVSASVTTDDGESWRFIGQIYRAAPETAYRPGYLCGYPDVTRLESGDLVAVLHTFPDGDGRVNLHFLRLRERG
jgi:hypothetical protein